MVAVVTLMNRMDFSSSIVYSLSFTPGDAFTPHGLHNEAVDACTALDSTRI